jgi:hypothetical protein
MDIVNLYFCVSVEHNCQYLWIKPFSFKEENVSLNNSIHLVQICKYFVYAQRTMFTVLYQEQQIELVGCKSIIYAKFVHLMQHWITKKI